jgi:uncharacterized membrane protein YfcA
VSDLVKVLLTGFAGVLTGILSGMFGVGGAIISTPAIRALGATPIAAVASTLPSILPSGISGSLRYHRDGAVNSRVAVWVASSGVLAAVGGSLLTDVVPGHGHVLMIVTAALIGYSAFRLSRAPARAPETVGAPVPSELASGYSASPPEVTLERLPVRDEWWRLLPIGLAAGALSGLLGVGGGLVMVPAFAGWLRIPLKEALGTSLACVAVLAIPGTITHALLGHIDWLYALPLCVGVIPGAAIGAHLALRSSDRTLRLLVGTTLGAIAVFYGVIEILAIV